MNEKIDWDKPIGLWWRNSKTDVHTDYVGTQSVRQDYHHVVRTKDDLIAVNDYGFILGHPEHTIRNVRDPQYRPYTPDELAALVGTAVRHKHTGDTVLIASHKQGKGYVFATRSPTLTDGLLLDDYTHLDGTPCGVLVEGDDESQ